MIEVATSVAFSKAFRPECDQIPLLMFRWHGF
jgi:hypothetical protein